VHTRYAYNIEIKEFFGNPFMEPNLRSCPKEIYGSFLSLMNYLSEDL